VTFLAVLPAPALAAFCFDLATPGGTAVGQVLLEPSVPAGAFTLVQGQFIHAAPSFCPAAENAAGVGNFALVGNTAHVGLTVGGTPNCFPVTLDMLINVTTLNGTFSLDVPSLALVVNGNATFTPACRAIR
jgi:hypothetical protein